MALKQRLIDSDDITGWSLIAETFQDEEIFSVIADYTVHQPMKKGKLKGLKLKVEIGCAEEVQARNIFEVLKSQDVGIHIDLKKEK